MGSVSFSNVMTLSLLGVTWLVVFRAVAKVCRFVIVIDWISSSITFDDSTSIDGRLALSKSRVMEIASPSVDA